MGDWKIVAARDEPWELYDMTTDRSETNNFAKEKPDTVRGLGAIWTKQFEDYTALATRDAPREQETNLKK